MAIETGARWGELIALRPRHFDSTHGTVTLVDTVVEVARKHSPTGERFVFKSLPKDDEPRTVSMDPATLDMVQAQIRDRGIGDDETAPEHLGHASVTTTQLYRRPLPDPENKTITAFNEPCCRDHFGRWADRATCQSNGTYPHRCEQR